MRVDPMIKLQNQAAALLATFAASLALPAVASAADLFSNAALLSKSDATACQRRGGGGGAARAAPAARPAAAQRPGGGGGGRQVRSNASSNVNHNVNANRNTNVNANRNVNINNNNNINVNVDNDYGRGWDDHYHPVARAAVVTAAVVTTAAVVGSIVYSVPPSCSTVIVNGISYSQCGSTWYAPRYSGTTVEYVVVNPPG
jgi:hypothetical protein